MRGRPFACLFACFLGAAAIACDNGSSVDGPTLGIDALGTVSGVLGGDPLITAVVTGCSGTPPALAYDGEGNLLHREDAAILYQSENMDAYPEGALLLSMLIPGDSFAPDVYGLPVAFDLEMRVFCQDRWVSSAPYPMEYVPAAESRAPSFNPQRFWASDSGAGDFLACVNTNELVNYEQGVGDGAERLELGWPCALATMTRGLGGRRYLKGKRRNAFTPGQGLAAIEPGGTGRPTLAWSRAMDLIGSWTSSDPEEDPVVLRTNATTGDYEVVVLDYENGEDLVGPLALVHDPVGALARNATGDILVLTKSSTVDPEPETRTVHVEKFDSGGEAHLGFPIEVANYDWAALSFTATFSRDGEHVYVSAAPNSDDTHWIEKVLIAAEPSLVWKTEVSTQPWRYAYGELAGRLLVASEEEFMWLDIESGHDWQDVQRFAPDSGRSFVHGHVEEDGSIVMIADPAVGNQTVGQGLYIFAPDGTATLRFNPGLGPLFRWLTPGWEPGGTLVSYQDEIHWLYTRAGYDDLL